VGFVGTVADITQRKEHEEREHLLMREINHRAKNMLSVVDAIAHQRQRFGTIVLQEMAERSVVGGVNLDYAPSGLTWRSSCPAANAPEHQEHGRISSEGKSNRGRDRKVNPCAGRVSFDARAGWRLSMIDAVVLFA
jgi:hypothetical protein